MNRLRGGYCHVANPFGGKIYNVSLKPEDCIAIVFWTRNPIPLMRHINEINNRGYHFYFNYSILGYPKAIETHNPSIETAIDAFKRLSDEITPDRVKWRYDPIVFSSVTPEKYHLEKFEKISKSLHGFTRHCTFSFVDFYKKTTQNFNGINNNTGVDFYSPSLVEQQDFSKKLLMIANTYGMSLNSCCNDDLVIEGINKNHCVDQKLLQYIRPDIFINLKAEPTREDCGCVSSVDIGSYNTCLFGCTYCYATNSRSNALIRHSSHDPLDTILWRPPSLSQIDLNKVAVSLKK